AKWKNRAKPTRGPCGLIPILPQRSSPACCRNHLGRNEFMQARQSSSTGLIDRLSELTSGITPRAAMWIGLIVIAAASFLIYRHALSGEFVLDDDTLLTENSIVKSPDGLYRFWCTREPTDYWPVSNSTFWLEWRIWGGSPNGYHATNLI